MNGLGGSTPLPVVNGYNLHYIDGGSVPFYLWRSGAVHELNRWSSELGIDAGDVESALSKEIIATASKPTYYITKKDVAKVCRAIHFRRNARLF